MHAERGVIGSGLPRHQRRAAGAAVWSRVGTTQPALARERRGGGGDVQAFDGDTDLFILPGHRFRVVDLLLTNFHLPRSTLYMLVCAFAGTGADAGGVRACDRGGISVLFLRRCVPA